MGFNPLVLPLVLTLASAFNSAFKWNTISERVPLWWDVDASPLLWVPRWVGVPILPILQLAISYHMYMLVSRDPLIEKQAGESRHAVAQLVALPSLFLFCVHNFVLLESTFVTPDHYFSARLFVASIALWLCVWLGYNLQYIEPNKSVGAVTPWTTRNPNVWRATSERAGLVLIAVGVILLFCAFFVPTGVALWVVTLLLWIGSYMYVSFYSWSISGDDSLKETLLPK